MGRRHKSLEELVNSLDKGNYLSPNEYELVREPEKDYSEHTWILKYIQPNGDMLLCSDVFQNGILHTKCISYHGPTW